jgi:hypothetical protein
MFALLSRTLGIRIRGVALGTEVSASGKPNATAQSPLEYILTLHLNVGHITFAAYNTQKTSDLRLVLLTAPLEQLR